MSLVNTIFDKVFRRKEERRKQEKRAPLAAEQKDAPASIVLSNASVAPGGITYGVLRAVRQSEKASDAVAINKYSFIVHTSANKTEIGRAVQSRYNVDVESVAVLNMPGKERRRGRQIGHRPGFKKTVVKIKAGQKIEMA